MQEIPGGKVDDTDETILHAVAREVKEETGLDVTRIVRKVGEFGWEEYSKRRARQVVWHKVVFEVEVKSTDTIVLDPVEHQDYLFAAQDEIVADQTAAGVPLTWITLPNKEVNVEAFRLRQKEAAPAQRDPATRIL
jgi:8-oxo-dGTP pyrophosphatase MutT (NUDIX family)